MKTLKFLLLILFLVPLHAQEDAEFKILQNLSVGGEIYELKYAANDDSFKVQIMLNNDTVKTQDIEWDIDPVILANSILQAINTKFSKSYTLSGLGASEKESLLQLKEKVLNRKRAALTEEQKLAD